MERFKIIVSIALIILFSSILALWLHQQRLDRKIEALKSLTQPKTASNSIPPSSSPSLTLPPSPSVIPSLEPSPSIEPNLSQVQPTVIPFQTQMIYLGSANTTQTNWIETNLEVRLNSNDFPENVNARFEAGLSIVNGEAWARLKNKTTGAIMSITEINNNTNATAWKTSPDFQLHSGNNIYVVEMKSSSSELANLTGARITISQ